MAKSAVTKLPDDDQVMPEPPTPDTGSVPRGQKGYDDFRAGVVELKTGKTMPKHPSP